MRIIIIDLHSAPLFTNSWYYLKFGIKGDKYAFLVDYALKHNIEICDFISGTHAGNPLLYHFHRIVPRAIFWDYLEARYVLKKNFGKNNITLFSKPGSIKDDDIIIGSIISKYVRDEVCTFPGHKVSFMSHFLTMQEPYDLSSNSWEAYMSETDLSENLFLKNHFNPVSLKGIICPYTFQNRFQNKGYNRKKKVLAIGYISRIDNPLFSRTYGNTWLHPSAPQVREMAKLHDDLIDDYLFSYENESHKTIDDNDLGIVRFCKKIYNRYMSVTMKGHFSYDIVEKFNEYLLFIRPEEVVGFSVSVVEGMACGAAYIGQDKDYYRKLGFIPGENYIAYDGTKQDLFDKIQYYLAHVEETRRIAKAGELFVRNMLNSETVAKNFYQDLADLINYHSRDQKE